MAMKMKMVLILLFVTRFFKLKKKKTLKFLSYYNKSKY